MSKGRLSLVAAVLVVAAVVALGGWHHSDKGLPMTSARDGVTADELARAGDARVFFGHQSVGMNLLDAVPGVYRAHGLTAPPVTEGTPAPGGSGGVFVHRFIGRNEDPMSKIKDFDATVRAGLGHQVDVAMMKFCYIDITTSTDVDALFAVYRGTLDALQRDFPGVTFLAVTVPLTTEQGLLAQAKNWIRRSDRMSPAENVVRERLNTLIRQHYSGKHLFDLAALESTAPDGSRVTGTSGGQPYAALYDGYSSDGGHLDVTGAQVVATGWLRAVAAVSAR
ncbi:MAG TPA: hypothetical protein VI248_01305 [Kineosporiaceae bacterium]